MLTEVEGLWLLGIFAVVMMAFVWLKTHAEKHADGFLVADRQVSMWNGAFSIAISWVWAPAIFVCSMQAYNLGLPGIFWFTVPNIVCFFVFAPLAIRLRKLMPNGYTLPEYMYHRFGGNRLVHLIFVLGFFFNMVVALVANAYAGGTLLNAMTGMDIHMAILGMSVTALVYSLMSGLRASVFTDVLQMILILGLAIVLVPWCVSALGGFDAVTAGLAGIDGQHGDVLHPGVAFAMGIPMTIALITGPLADQMFVQRAMAVKQEDIKKTFVYGGLIFGCIPVILSLLGFMAVPLAQQGLITVDNPEMVGPLVIAHALPTVALYAFIIMAFAGLCSTLDSAFCGISALGGVDIYKRYIQPDAVDKRLLRASRVAMLIAGVLGTGIALMKPNMLWTFMIGGNITAAFFFPIILALFWSRVTACGVFAAVAVSLAIGLPFAIYANVNENELLIVWSSVISVSLGLIVCVISGLLNKSPAYEFKEIK